MHPRTMVNKVKGHRVRKQTPGSNWKMVNIQETQRDEKVDFPEPSNDDKLAKRDSDNGDHKSRCLAPLLLRVGWRLLRS